MSPAAHPDANVMGSLAQKIAQIFTAPDTVIGLGPGSGPGLVQGATAGAGPAGAAAQRVPFLSFPAPGVPLAGSDLDFGDMTTKQEIDANAAFSQMVNNIPASQGFWTLTGRKIWNVYEDAITQVTLPATSLSARQKRQLDDALAFLTRTATRINPFTGARTQVVQDTPELVAFMAYRTAYVAAVSTYNGMEIQANSPGASNSLVQDWARNGAAYESQVRSAYGSWVTDGHRGDVEEAIGVIRTLAGQGPESLYRTLRAIFAADQMTDTLGEVFYPTFVYPTDPLMAALKASWTPLEFNLQDVHTFQPDGRIGSGGSAGPGWGLWSGSSSAEYGTGQRTFPCDTTGLMVQAELLQVPLSRAWLRPEIFSSRGWRWAPSAGFGPVSDGGITPVGLMPLLPTAVVLAQNVMINLDMTTQPNASSWSAISSGSWGASIGWGPFAIQGNRSHSHPRASAESHFTQTSGGISVPGPQIVAFVCDVIGRSPDPDPALEWPV